MGEYPLIPARVQSFSTYELQVNRDRSGLDGVLILMGWKNNLSIRFAGSFLFFNKIAATIRQLDGKLARGKPEKALRQNSVKTDGFFL